MCARRAHKSRHQPLIELFGDVTPASTHAEHPDCIHRAEKPDEARVTEKAQAESDIYQFIFEQIENVSHLEALLLGQTKAIHGFSSFACLPCLLFWPRFSAKTTAGASGNKAVPRDALGAFQNFERNERSLN